MELVNAWYSGLVRRLVRTPIPQSAIATDTHWGVHWYGSSAGLVDCACSQMLMIPVMMQAERVPSGSRQFLATMCLPVVGNARRPNDGVLRGCSGRFRPSDRVETDSGKQV